MNIPLNKPAYANDIAEILCDRRPVTFQKGEVIIKAAAPCTNVIYLESGLVKVIQENQNGKTNILQITNEGQFIGIICMLCNLENTYTCIALNDVKVSYITHTQFREYLKKNTEFNTYITKETLLLLQKNVNRLITIHNKQLPGRVADVILYFFELYNRSKTFEFPLSREELAQFACTTKESFIRTLTEFKNDKIIILDGKSVIINSLEIVQTLSRLG